MGHAISRCLLLYVLLLALRPAVTGAADDVHIFTGTVATLDAEMTRMTIVWEHQGEPEAAAVAIFPSTSITRDGVGVARSALRVGLEVTVLAVENPYLILDVLEATDILLGRQDVRAIFDR